MPGPRPTLRIATRRSPLALWQAGHVRARLLGLHGGIEVELVGIETKGDKILDSPLANVGGKGLFVKELEQSLEAGETDIAVHSMKDVTVDLPEGLELAVIMKREDPRDALISDRYADLDELPEGARIGTSSLRRQSQLRALGRGFVVRDLRGNVGTRLKRLDDGQFDAIILAAAGVIRLGLEARVRELLDPSLMLPAIGQGAIGIECRADDEVTRALIAPLNHADTAVCVGAERAVNRRLSGGCQAPVAGHALLRAGNLYLEALVARPDGGEIVRGRAVGEADSGEQMGIALAEDLLQRGAAAILQALREPGPPTGERL